MTIQRGFVTPAVPEKTTLDRYLPDLMSTRNEVRRAPSPVGARSTFSWRARKTPDLRTPGSVPGWREEALAEGGGHQPVAP